MPSRPSLISRRSDAGCAWSASQSSAAAMVRDSTTGVEEAAKLLDLEQYLDRKPGQLSGGERHRRHGSRHRARTRRCSSMDEPLSNLDAKLRVQTRAEIADCSAASAPPPSTSPTTRSRP